jgi:hypothetical protein
LADRVLYGKHGPDTGGEFRASQKRTDEHALRDPCQTRSPTGYLSENVTSVGDQRSAEGESVVRGGTTPGRVRAV